MAPFHIEVCTFSLLSLFSFYLVYPVCDDTQRGDHFRVRLAQLLVALLTLLICLGRSTPMVLMGLLGSVLWGIT